MLCKQRDYIRLILFINWRLWVWRWLNFFVRFLTHSSLSMSHSIFPFWKRIFVRWTTKASVLSLCYKFALMYEKRNVIMKCNWPHSHKSSTNCSTNFHYVQDEGTQFTKFSSIKFEMQKLFGELVESCFFKCICNIVFLSEFSIFSLFFYLIYTQHVVSYMWSWKRCCTHKIVKKQSELKLKFVIIIHK
jgi:hypothetical protein